MEHGSDREAAVLGRDLEDLAGIALGHKAQVELAMHRQLRLSRRPRGAKPEAGRLLPGWIRRNVARSRRQLRPVSAAQDDIGQFRRAGQQILDHVRPLGRDECDSTASVGGDAAQVAAGQQRVDGQWDRAQAHRAEEAGDELDTVEEHEQDALLQPDTQAAQATRGGFHMIEQLAVRERSVLDDERDTVAVTRSDMPVDEVFADVEEWRVHSLLPFRVDTSLREGS